MSILQASMGGNRSRNVEQTHFCMSMRALFHVVSIVRCLLVCFTEIELSSCLPANDAPVRIFAVCLRGFLVTLQMWLTKPPNHPHALDSKGTLKISNS